MVNRRKHVLLIFACVIMVQTALLTGEEIHDAANQGDLERVKRLLLAHPEWLEAKDAAGRTPLHFAVNSGNEDVILYLLSKGADCTAKTNVNTTVLHYAALNGRLDIVTLFMDKGLDLSMKNVQGATPLTYAVMRGHEDVVAFLVEKGADVDALDEEEGTPLHTAAQAGHLEVVKTLTAKGAKIDWQDVCGRTALHFACTHGNRKLVEFLVQHGMEFDDEDRFGKTPLFYTAENGHQTVVDLFLTKEWSDVHHTGRDGSMYLHAACRGGLKDFAGFLIRKGININTRNVYGEVPLHEAAKRGHKDIVALLIDQGTDINIEGYGGETAVHLAMVGDHTDVVRLLKEKGADDRPAEFPMLTEPYPAPSEPGPEPRLFVPGIVSTGDGNERDISFSPDGKTFFFTRWARGQSWNIMGMIREEGRWTAPEKAPFSGEYLDAEACFIPDGRGLFFISNRPRSGDGPAESWEIWTVSRDEDGWDTPRLLGSPFEGGFYPTFTRDWVMYFTGSDNDLYRSRYVEGEFKIPESLGMNINTPEAEYNAFVASDESYIIFTSHGWGKGLGEHDLYISYRKQDGSWTKAMNMGPRINSFARDYCPSISPDGRYFFFASSRLGTEDIFWMDASVIEDLKSDAFK